MRTVTVTATVQATITLPDDMPTTDWMRTAANGLADLLPRVIERGEEITMEKEWSPAPAIRIQGVIVGWKPMDSASWSPAESAPTAAPPAPVPAEPPAGQQFDLI